jgi:hypothetical protein
VHLHAAATDRALERLDAGSDVLRCDGGFYRQILERAVVHRQLG